MDILEIPNLRQKSTEVLKRWFQQTCLGLELQDNPLLSPEETLLVCSLYGRCRDLSMVVVVGTYYFSCGSEALRLQVLGATIRHHRFLAVLIAQPVVVHCQVF